MNWLSGKQIGCSADRLTLPHGWKLSRGNENYKNGRLTLQHHVVRPSNETRQRMVRLSLYLDQIGKYQLVSESRCAINDE